MNSCSCAELMIGFERSGCFNWNPDCAVHGVLSDWYRSDEQVEKRKVERDQTVELQRLAREARRKARQALSE